MVGLLWECFPSVSDCDSCGWASECFKWHTDITVSEAENDGLTQLEKEGDPFHIYYFESASNQLISHPPIDPIPIPSG